jgi:serine/threonine protein kinase
MTYIRQFSSYTVLHQIGEGGMAKVYLVEHKTLGHQVTAKVLRKSFLITKTFVLDLLF